MSRLVLRQFDTDGLIIDACLSPIKPLDGEVRPFVLHWDANGSGCIVIDKLRCFTTVFEHHSTLLNGNLRGITTTFDS